MSGQAYQRSAAGLIGAIVVLVVVVVGFVVLRDLTRVEPEGPAGAVDYLHTADRAREQAGFQVLAPEDLPAGWRATSVEFVPEPPRWHLGVLTEEGEYVGLEQAKSSVRSMLTTYVGGEPTRGADVTIDRERWSTWRDAEGDTALLRGSEGEVTTLVVGPVGRDVLVRYVKILR